MSNDSDITPAGRTLRRIAAVTLAVTLAAFLGLGAMAAGWTDSWSQEMAMLAVIVVMGLAVLSIPLNLGVLAASVIHGRRHGARPMRAVYAGLGLAGLGYATLAVLVVSP